MTESGAPGVPGADPCQAGDLSVLIDALRSRGAEHFDPVGFRFIEALARRAAAHQDEARRVLDRRLAEAIADYGERLDRARREAMDSLVGRTHRRLARLEVQAGSGPLAELLAHIHQHARNGTTSEPAQATGALIEPQGELKSLSYFRSTWSRLSVDQQLSHAYTQAPDNAGPLNSHFLVLQALRQMRDISPEYLEQFMSYVDALLWLDQADSGRSLALKKATRGERDKRKSGRGNAG